MRNEDIDFIIRCRGAKTCVRFGQPAPIASQVLECQGLNVEEEVKWVIRIR
jgi:hypothetical protein